MRIYVAGRWTRKDEVRRVQAALRDAGHRITHDWTQAEEPPEHWSEDKKREYLARQAAGDLDGVLGADVVVLLHDDTGRGLFVELGAALIDGQRIIVVGAPRHPGACVFYFLPEIEHVETPAEAVSLLLADEEDAA